MLFVPVNWSHEYREMTASWRDKLLPVANKYVLKPLSAVVIKYAKDTVEHNFFLQCKYTKGKKNSKYEMRSNLYLYKTLTGKIFTHLNSTVAITVRCTQYNVQ